MGMLSVVIGGIVGVWAMRGFALGIRREVWESPTPAEWLVSAGVGVLTGVMVAVLIRG